MSIKITPRGKFVYAQLDTVEEKKTDGGIILPDNHSEGTRLAKVIAKGPDVSQDVEVGGIYAVSWFVGDALHFVTRGMLNDTFRLISDSELKARIEETESGDA